MEFELIWAACYHVSEAIQEQWEPLKEILIQGLMLEVQCVYFCGIKWKELEEMEMEHNIQMYVLTGV